MYNPEIKERFLKNYPPQTQITYKRVFLKSEYMEELLGKDLYEFNLSEIEDVLYHMNPKTMPASLLNGRTLTAYISWAIEQGLRSNTINPLKAFSSSYFDKFIDKSLKLYFNDSEIRQIEDGCNNPQDAVIIRLLFEGVNGKYYSELRNLKKQDVDFDNCILTLTDQDGEQRKLKVSQRAIDLIGKAIEQKHYWKRNGEVDPTSNVREYTDLVDNDYVIRPSNTKVEDVNSPIKKNVLFRRIRMISDVFGLPYLAANNITKSGIIYLAKEKVKEGWNVDTKLYKEIAQRFNYNNFYRLKDFVNKENLTDLYEEELENIL